jgi:hypothetical protein
MDISLFPLKQFYIHHKKMKILTDIIKTKLKTKEEKTTIIDLFYFFNFDFDCDSYFKNIIVIVTIIGIAQPNKMKEKLRNSK